MNNPRIGRLTYAVFLMTLLSIVGATSLRPQQRRARPARTLRLYVFDCGVIRGLDPALFNFKKEELATTDLAVPCYLVVNPKGTLMWDVGVIPDTAFQSDGAPITQGYSTATKALKTQLAEIGYSPADITYIAFSHYHSDHIANANEFAGATWLVRQVERDAMFAEKPPALVNPALYSELKNSKTVILTKDEYDVFGDGTVIIKSAPGHTPGHQVLILKLAKAGRVMLAGDLYHYPEERKLNRVPTFEFNKEQSLASRAMIEAYVKRTHTQLWIEHDFAANSKLKKAPKYYD
ncbi:MAG TPA: N-acyl homoserine lactonase family protein [Candidatus Polarisedimenticolia bacterium]|nr:N-acyl homoserine lactonase family protein [Candidatus Polarisedimenticolia bacterium]